MSSLSDHSLPSTKRLLQHAVVMGLLAGIGFGLGRGVFSGSNAASLALAMLAVVGYSLLRMMLRIHRTEAQLAALRQTAAEDARQATALTSLIAMIDPIRPLPSTRGWAMSPDLLCHIAGLVLDRRPQLVLEASSGVSTIVIAYCLKRLGTGKVIALEHDQQFAAASQQQLCEHDLESFARVIHAPLVAHQVNGQSMQWYDLTKFTDSDQIDLFVIDGPPSIDRGPHQARFPALPLLYPRLAPGCQIVLDDADRDGEREIVQLWLRQFPDLDHRHLPCEKGASILTKGPETQADSVLP